MDKSNLTQVIFQAMNSTKDDGQIRSFDYRKGYFKALLDVKNYFETHSESLKYNKMYNSKKIPLLLQAFIDNCDKMMLEGDYVEITIRREK